MRGEGDGAAVGREAEPGDVDLAGRELAGLPRGHVDHPEPAPGVEIGRGPRVVLLLLPLLPLLALRLAGEERDPFPVGRPLEAGDGPGGRGEGHRLPAVRPDEPDLPLRVAGVVRLRPRPRPLGEERHPLPVRGPAGRLVGSGRRGERARLAARRRDEPHVGLVAVLFFVQRFDDVGHEPPVRRDLRVAHRLQAEDVVARPRAVVRPAGGGQGEEQEKGEPSSRHSGPP